MIASIARLPGIAEPTLDASRTHRSSSPLDHQPPEAVLLPPADEVSLEAALEAVGTGPEGAVGRFQWRMVLVCGAGWLADNAWLNLGRLFSGRWCSGVILIEAQVQPEFGLSNSQTTFLLTMLFIGEIAGCSLWGPISDRFGRKPAFLGSLAIAGVAGLATAFAPNYGTLLVLLFVVGTGVGGNLPVDGALFSELVPTSQRGRLMTFLSAFWSLGNFLSSLLAWAAIPPHSCGSELGSSGCSTWDNSGWRIVVGVLAVLNLVFLALRVGVPESPAYLLKTGRVLEANAVMSAMAIENGQSWNDTATLVCTEEQDSGGQEKEGSGLTRAFKQLVQDLKQLSLMKQMVFTVMLLACIWFFSNLGYGLFNPIVPRLLKRKNIAANTHLYRDLLINAAAGVPGSLLAAWLVETRLGRTKTIAFSALTMAAALAAFNLVTDETSVVIANSFISFASQPMYAAIYLYTPEVIPTAVRGTIVALLAAMSRTSGTIAPSLADLFLDHDLERVLWGLCLASIGLTALCGLLLPIETHERKLS